MTLNVLFYQVVFKKDGPFYVQKESCFSASDASIYFSFVFYGVQ